MPHVQDFAKKVAILCAHQRWNQKALAARLGVADAVLTTWIRGSIPKDIPPEQPSQQGLTKLSELLVDLFPTAVDDLHAARQLWEGSLGKFERLVMAKGNERFLDLLESAPRKEMFQYLPGGVDGRRAVMVHGANDAMDSDVYTAEVGEHFAFLFKGPAGARIVILVESVLGIQLIGSSCSDAQGRALLPSLTGTYSFEEPRGLHRFLGFAITPSRSLSIDSTIGRQLPLFESELDAFAEELSEQTPGRSHLLDTVRVHVR